MILRRPDPMNNNGITSTNKRDKMPLIANKSLINETKQENTGTSPALPPVTTATAISPVKTYDYEGFQ